MEMMLLKPLRRVTTALLLVTCAAAAAYGQESARIRIGDLERLEARAAQVLDVNIDERLLQLAIKWLDPKDPDQAKIKDVVNGLKGVYVKSYDFDRPDEYSTADIAPITAQLRAPGWSRMVGVRSARDKENLEVFTMLVGNNISGIAVIATSPKQLTIINIVGPIDLEKLAALGGTFRIPKLDIHIDPPKKKE